MNFGLRLTVVLLSSLFMQAGICLAPAESNAENAVVIFDEQHSAVRAMQDFMEYAESKNEHLDYIDWWYLKVAMYMFFSYHRAIYDSPTPQHQIFFMQNLSEFLRELSLYIPKILHAQEDGNAMPIKLSVADCYREKQMLLNNAFEKDIIHLKKLLECNFKLIANNPGSSFIERDESSRGTKLSALISNDKSASLNNMHIACVLFDYIKQKVFSFTLQFDRHRAKKARLSQPLGKYLFIITNSHPTGLSLLIIKVCAEGFGTVLNFPGLLNILGGIKPKCVYLKSDPHNDRIFRLDYETATPGQFIKITYSIYETTDIAGHCQLYLRSLGCS